MMVVLQWALLVWFVRTMRILGVIAWVIHAMVMADHFTAFGWRCNPSRKGTKAECGENADHH